MIPFALASEGDFDSRRPRADLKHDKMEIVADGSAEALISIGKGASLSAESIAAAFVPCDESIAHIDYRHLNSPSAMLLCEIFRSGE